MKILVTGATGYIGGRIVPRLVEAGHDITVLVRDSRRIMGRDGYEQVVVKQGNLLDDPPEWADDLGEFDAAYYLVHSIYAGGMYADFDQRCARNFCTAMQGKIGHLIYLGGLLPEHPEVSEHLRSRAETGVILREQMPTTEFRAGPIIGSGSASFEMVRYLTERLPIMIAPKWIRNEVQPIAVRDIISYLLEALEHEPLGIVDVGMEETPTFREMMYGYAEVRGMKRKIIALPVLTPGLAARWVGLVTPITNKLAVPLVRGMVHPITGDTTRAKELFPEIKPLPYKLAVDYALRKIAAHNVETRWSGSLDVPSTYRLTDWEGTLREERTIHVPAEPEAVYRAFSSLGGDRGWLVWGWAWRLRGWVDQFLGGPGLRRGRRDPEKIFIGEALDFWRVEDARPPQMIRLRAEMKVPGQAWLQFQAFPEDTGTRLVQTALFRPDGFFGNIYWWSMYPAHMFIFSQMIRAVGELALREYAGESERSETASGETVSP